MNRRELIAASIGIAAASRVQADTSKPKLRVAMLGIGHAHAIAKASVLQASPDYEWAGTCEPDAGLRQRFGGDKAFRNTRWMDLDTLLSDSEIRLIAVESLVKDNLRYARAAIEAGKHIHLDKPPGNDLAEFRALLDEAKRRQLQVQMGYMWRYNRGLQVAIEAARKGWLGDVYLVRGAISSDIDPAARIPLAEFRGGMMFELGCHLLDRVVDLLGRPRKVTSFLRHDGPQRDGLEDSALAILEYDKTIAQIYSTAQQPSGGNHRELVIQGTNGTARVSPIEPPTLMVDLKTAAGNFKAGSQQLSISTEPRYVADFAELAKVIRGEQKPSYSMDHDLLVQETLLKACGV